MLNSEMPTAQAEAAHNINTEIIVTEAPKKRGRKPLPEAVRAERRASQAATNRKKQDARRSALAILSTRHDNEFNELLKEELSKFGF
jgi:putative protein kinase ArgK-like GTPase of G3E family